MYELVTPSQRYCLYCVEYLKVVFLVLFCSFYISMISHHYSKLCFRFCLPMTPSVYTLPRLPMTFNIIQEDLNKASYWSVSTNLSFNCVKCAVLHFWCSNNNTAQYLLNNIIDSRESIKDLGIMITSDLSWSTHCNMVVSRAYKQLGLIHRSFKTTSIPVKKKLYIS